MHLSFILFRNISKFNTNSFKIYNRLFNNVSFEDITYVSPTFIKKTLSANNVNFQEGHTCFLINCPQCKNNEIKKQSTNLYINKTTGNFTCVSCLSHGQWPNLETYLNTKKTKKVKDIKILNVTSDLKTTQEYVQHVENNNTLLNTLPEEVILSVWKTFNFPSASHSAIDSVNIRIDSTQKRLYLPLEDVNSQVVGYRVLCKKSENEIEHNVEPSKNCIGILCGKSGKCKDTAILVPNISDFLVLLKSKTSHYIICLPNGYKNLPLHILSSLERFSKITLWFGNDINSWDSARNFSRKLGEKRCLFVRPSEKQPLPHLAAEKDIKAIVASAQTIWHKSITTFSSLKEDVLSELQNVDKVHGIKWKRFPTLNKLLKGHRRGELTVLTGPTGCGKTTFISEYSLDLAMQGINTLWGSFEIRNVRLAKTMLQQFAELPLDKHINRFEEFACQFEKLPIYFMTFYGQQSVKVVMEAVEHAQYVHDIAHVVIDNVQFMMGIGDGEKHLDRFWKQDVIIAAFRNFATRRNCHVTLVIHPRKERAEEDLTTSSIFGGAKASQEADNILIVQDKLLITPKGKKYLQISKNRYSGDLGLMQLDFDKNSLSFAQKKKKEDKVNESKLVNDS